jgi:hypothetical protein
VRAIFGLCTHYDKPAPIMIYGLGRDAMNLFGAVCFLARKEMQV